MACAIIMMRVVIWLAVCGPRFKFVVFGLSDEECGPRFTMSRPLKREMEGVFVKSEKLDQLYIARKSDEALHSIRQAFNDVFQYQDTQDSIKLFYAINSLSNSFDCLIKILEKYHAPNE